MSLGSSAADPVFSFPSQCGEVTRKPAQPGSLLASREAVQTKGGTSGRAYLFHLDEEAVDEVSGRAGVWTALVVFDAVNNEVLHAPRILRKASVRLGTQSRRIKKLYHWGWGGLGGVWRSRQGVRE